MKKITKILSLLTLTLGLTFGWSCSAHAAVSPDSEPDQPDTSLGLRTVLEGCYQLTDGKLVEVKELEIDKVYFISATLQNVADQNIDYWIPDQRYNDELYGIWFQLKLPITFSHDAPGQVVLEAGACRRNPDDQWNTSDTALLVYAQAGTDLALEFAPGYCGIDALRQIDNYHYYLRPEDDYTSVHGIHDSEGSIQPGAERKILLAVRTRDAQEFAMKRQLIEANHLRVSAGAKSKPAMSSIIRALPVTGDVMELPLVIDFTLPRPELSTQRCLTAQIKLPRWLEQQSNDQWWLQTKGKVYAEDGRVCFWAGLYNRGVIYDLDGADAQNVFDLQALLVHLDSVEAWYLDADGKKVVLELSEIVSLPEPSTLSDPSLIPENNGLAAEIALNGDLVRQLAGKTIYLSYDYSLVHIDQ